MSVEASVRPRLMPRQMVRTRDGIDLCTDVYLPEALEPASTVLIRTPYGRSRPFLMLLARRLSQAGLCAVVQDCRGRYQSGGTFELDREEGDSRDTLAWAAAQPWSNRAFGLVGVSISTYSNFRAAAAEAAIEGVEIKALVSVMGAFDCHALFFRHGALVLHWALPWATLMSARHAGKNAWLQLPWAKILRQLPLADLPLRTSGHVELWRDVIAHPAYTEGWRRLSALERYDDLDVPALYLCGWNDFLLGHTLAAFRRMAERSERPPAYQQMVLGPWDHQTIFYSFGGPKGGEAQPEHEIDLMEVVESWFERWLHVGEASARPRPEPEPQAILYVPQRRAWLASDAFPLAASKTREWYLSSAAGANGADGDGCLLDAPSSAPGTDSFVYDPENPVPTAGGAVWPFDPVGLEPGPVDQSAVEERPDVLVYTSEPLTEPLVALGAAEVELWAATSARDTDFTAKLVDVDRGGVARIVQDGIVRGRFREALEKEVFLEPHRPARYLIDLQAIAHCFEPGHRIRLEISSSNFPKYDRNLNTATAFHTATTSLVANQAVFHGGTTVSRLRLATISPADFDALTWSPPPSWRGRPPA